MVDVKIDASKNPELFRRAFSEAVGAKPLPFTHHKESSAGELPQSWSEIEGRVFKFSGADERAEFARQAMLDGRAPHPRSDVEELSSVGVKDHITAWLAWAEQKPFPSVLQSPKPSAWHKVREAYAASRILWGKSEADAEGHLRLKIGEDYGSIFADEPQVILIEHDWARAFKGATDFDQGEFPLPYDRCVFEFRLAGKRVVVLTFSHQCTVITEIGIGYWVASDLGDLPEIKDLSRYGILYDNIRAVCIALDAEVAVTEVVRAPHRLNIAREKQGKLPVNDYHVINLAKRSRVEALPSGEHEAKWHPRLHFRRGHWRHYENHKTWIKWCLCGDPDLGFVDKEYRV